MGIMNRFMRRNHFFLRRSSRSLIVMSQSVRNVEIVILTLQATNLKNQNNPNASQHHSFQKNQKFQSQLPSQFLNQNPSVPPATNARLHATMKPTVPLPKNHQNQKNQTAQKMKMVATNAHPKTHPNATLKTPAHQTPAAQKTPPTVNPAQNPNPNQKCQLPKNQK